MPKMANGAEPVARRIDVAYQIAGDGPAVISIQGIGVIGNGWRPQIDELACRFRIVTFDASHALPIQCPREINALLLQHLTSAER